MTNLKNKKIENSSIEVDNNNNNNNNNNNKNQNNKKRTLEISYTNKFQFLDSSDSGGESDTDKEMNRVSLKKKKKSSPISNKLSQDLKKKEQKFKTTNDTVTDYNTNNGGGGVGSNGEIQKPTFSINRNNCTIKDIQDYIVWLMLRFKVPTPNWIFTAMSPLIKKVVVVSIQGISSLMHDKLSLLSGKDHLFSQVFEAKNKVELQFPNYNHIFESLLNVKTCKVQKIDTCEKMRKEIEPISFYLLDDQQLVENGYFTIKDLKDGWVYSNQVKQILNLIKPSNDDDNNNNNQEEDNGASSPTTTTVNSDDDNNDNNNNLINKLNLKVKEMLAIDCEMCRTEGGQLELTRISIVNEQKKVVLNELVLPEKPIIDYLTQYSGITADTLKNVTNRLSDIHAKLEKLVGVDTVLIGHSLENDLKAMKFIHRKIIDTSILYPTGSSGKFSLKYLTKKYLNRIIQSTKHGKLGHDSIEDARAAMDLAQLKIQKGKSFGTRLASMENLFDKINKHEKKSSFIDRLEDIKTFTSQVVSCFNCENDNEVIEKIIKQSSNSSSSDLIFSQLTSLSDHFKSLLPKQFSITNPEENKLTTTTTTTTTTITNPIETIIDSPLLTEKEIKEIHSLDSIEINTTVKQIVRQMELQIKNVYDKLQENSMLLLILGPGPLNDIIRFQGDGNKQKDYYLSVDTAKEGVAFLALK
ncbi:RNA exonuclease 1 [Dictyostelium discoideum AX4]|uniref:RNA exonuclease 1 n=1 Tax=Dictyostelium discoideum TaxID=44689 RepID=Q54EC1_DICDI|nr:RNA exonuclease 1 [Dictyostelium discoideum AX4]EAL61779.1 RNA exonuclease 1 [Dictyostelium discoideum AX4]|eukprot:XP_635319.1 RNA exonuclease 1 [Dictyostelium discoideum AX4]